MSSIQMLLAKRKPTLNDWITWVDAQTAVEGDTIDNTESTTLDAASGSITSEFDVISGTFSDTGSMIGSPWAERFVGGGSGSINRVIQHAMPDTDAWTQLKAQGNTRVLIAFEEIPGSYAMSSLNRNGYTSGGPQSADPTFRTSKVYYWDDDDQKAYKINPLSAGSPTEFEFI